MPQSSIRPRVIERLKNVPHDNSLISIEYIPKTGKNKGIVYEQFYKGNSYRLLAWLKDVTEEINGELYKKDLQGTLWDFVGETKNLTKEGGIVFSNAKKPVKMIQQVIDMCTFENSIILDSFAGSGTTAHAVLNMNKQDGGNRKFILVEMEDYAESITAERVRRVIDGYGTGKNIVEGTGGGFSYYELGEPLFKNEYQLNESIPIEKIYEYVWYMETNTSYNPPNSENKYYLGEKDQTSYYFYYKKDSYTILDMEFLSTIKHKTENYIIYADKLAIDEKQLQKYRITFKKIPRDISKL